MMTCPAVTSQHDGRAVRTYIDPASGRRVPLCRGCASVASAMGAALIPDRRNDPARADRIAA